MPRCIHCPNEVAVRGTRCPECRTRHGRQYKGVRTVISLRIPDAIYNEAKTMAKLNDEPLTDWIVDAIRRRINDAE